MMGGNPITIFIANLLRLTTRSWLQGLFRQWGWMTDVFIPKKKDLFGRAYGFVRMESGM